jgi:hypothetical protein
MSRIRIGDDLPPGVNVGILPNKDLSASSE